MVQDEICAPKPHPVIAQILHSFLMKHANRACASFTDEEKWEIEEAATEQVARFGGIHEALIDLEYAGELPIKGDYKILSERFDRTKVQVSRAVLQTVELHVYVQLAEILDRLEKKGKKIDFRRQIVREIKRIERKIRRQNRRFPYPRIEENF